MCKTSSTTKKKKIYIIFDWFLEKNPYILIGAGAILFIFGVICSASSNNISSWISPILGFASACVTFLPFCKYFYDEMQKNINKIDTKIECFNETITLSELGQIENNFGRKKREQPCEIWIVSNTLQESNEDDEILLNTIYDNITDYNIEYKYILPNTKDAHEQIEKFEKKLQEKHRILKKKETGKIEYRFYEKLDEIMPAEYFDIVLYIIRSKNIDNLDPKDVSFGYQCFSNKKEEKQDKDNKGYKDNKLNVNYQYYYNEIKGESLAKIENYYNGCFTGLNIKTKDTDDENDATVGQN